jgi:hypothetical protein
VYGTYASGSTAYAATASGLSICTHTLPTTATLTINYQEGAPGSQFLIEGYNFRSNATLELRVNGILVNNTTTIDPEGRFTLLLVTLPQAAQGYYEIIASASDPGSSSTPPEGSSWYGRSGYHLRAEAELRTAPELAPIAIEIPTDIPVFWWNIYLPVVRR